MTEPAHGIFNSVFFCAKLLKQQKQHVTVVTSRLAQSDPLPNQLTQGKGLVVVGGMYDAMHQLVAEKFH